MNEHWRYTMDPFGEMRPMPDVSQMRFPARCTSCSTVYDMGKVTVTGRYTDCSVWKCPGCGITVDDRPHSVGHAHHYVELDRDGREVRDR